MLKMKTKKIKEFLADYKLTREELADALNYCETTVVNLLNKKTELEGRSKMSMYLGMRNLLKKKISLYEKGLELWEKDHKI